MNAEFLSTPRHSLCGNCCKAIHNEGCRTTVKINDFGMDEVGIIDAISYIYGISWDEFLAYSEKLLKNDSEGNPLDGKEEESVHFCDSCSLLLSQNYISLRRFENESHFLSVVQQINYFRQQQQFSSIQEKEINEDFVSTPEDVNPEEDDDDFVESFNFEDEDKEEDEIVDDVTIEEKYEPENDDNDDTLEQNSISDSIIKEEPPSSPSITRNSLRLRQPIKLYSNNIPNENFKCLRSTYLRRQTMSQIQITPRTNTSKIVGEQKVGRQCKTNCTNSQRRGKYPRKVSEFKEFGYYNNKHLYLHDRNYFRSKSTKCKICGKMVTRPKIKKHMDLFHGDEKTRQKWRYPCKICDKDYSEAGLRLHIQSKHSGPREIYKCVVCHKTYRSKLRYDQHILTHSDNFKPDVCEQCGKTFYSRHYFQLHQKTHNNTYKFSCDICLKKFQNRSLLEFHQQTHSTERKFECGHKDCRKTYKFKNHLMAHLKTHTDIAKLGEMNVKCEQCGKIFKHSDSLLKHIRRFHEDHATRSKLYMCSICGKRLSTKGNLKLHENGMHKNNPKIKGNHKIEPKSSPSTSSM